MIPEMIFIKMDDTLFNFVVYFSLNKNSVNHWFFTPFMKPDYNIYGEAPRLKGNRELKELRRRPRQLKKKKTIGLMIKTTALTCITLFSTFL